MPPRRKYPENITLTMLHDDQDAFLDWLVHERGYQRTDAVREAVTWHMRNSGAFVPEYSEKPRLDKRLNPVPITEDMKAHIAGVLQQIIEDPMPFERLSQAAAVRRIIDAYRYFHRFRVPEAVEATQ